MIFSQAITLSIIGVRIVSPSTEDVVVSRGLLLFAAGTCVVFLFEFIILESSFEMLSEHIRIQTYLTFSEIAIGSCAVFAIVKAKDCESDEAKATSDALWIVTMIFVFSSCIATFLSAITLVILND